MSNLVKELSDMGYEPQFTSAVDVYRIYLSDTEKLADLADYISANYSDELFNSVVVSVNGSDYFFLHK